MNNIGDQKITFQYQQQGTAFGFNQLITDVIPTGIISGGEVSRDSNGDVRISVLDMIIKDADGEVSVHVKTNSTILLYDSDCDFENNPYVIAQFTWVESSDNYVEFTSCDSGTLSINPNALVLCKLDFDSGNFKGVDYTFKSWSSSHYNNNFLYTDAEGFNKPSFLVTPTNNYTGLIVNKGEAIIDGISVVKNSAETISLSSLDIGSVSNGYKKKVLLVLKSDGTYRTIKGNSTTGTPTTPTYPYDGLVIAELLFENTNSKIYGNNIKYIYNNNSVGKSLPELPPSITINVNTENHYIQFVH